MIETAKLQSILERPELRKGLQTYQTIMEAFPETDVSKDRAFQKLYRDFYQMRPFYTDDFASAYFRLMEKMKTWLPVSFDMAFERIKHIKGSYEMSFSSKMVHTIDPNLPIWDKIVTGEHFHMKAPYCSCRNRERVCCRRYEDYRKRFCSYTDSPEGQMLIESFDAAFPDSGISDVKKIDFILWQDRKI